MKRLRILAVEPFYGGSHKLFLDGLIKHSGHDFTLLSSSARFWKWRYASSAFHFCADIKERLETTDLLFCSNLFDLFSAVTLVPELRRIPKLIYFHENQAAYPVQAGSKRNMHYVLQDLKNIYVADLALFNSQWNLSSLREDSKKYIQRLPELGKSLETLYSIKTPCRVQPLGIELQSLLRANKNKENRKPVILWNHRWEFDKNPNLLFDALAGLRKESLDFGLIVCGEQKKSYPKVFDQIKQEYSENILSWGELGRQEYKQALLKSDIGLSTSDHEFFGISVSEAIAAGCYPLLPWRLSYPELVPKELYPQMLYRTKEDLVEKLINLVRRYPFVAPSILRETIAAFDWSEQSQQYDQRFVECFNEFVNCQTDKKCK